MSLTVKLLGKFSWGEVGKMISPTRNNTEISRPRKDKTASPWRGPYRNLCMTLTGNDNTSTEKTMISCSELRTASI